MEEKQVLVDQEVSNGAESENKLQKVLIEKLKHFVSDEEGMKRKLLIDGDGAGDNRVLNNIVKNFIQLFTNYESSDSQQSGDNVNNLLDAVQQSELSMQHSVQKIKMVAQELENCESTYTNIEQAISEANIKLARCKAELEDAKNVRSNKQQYDLVSRIIEQHPSTHVTQREILTLEEEIAQLQQINDKIDDKFEKRKKQFQLLLYASNKLKNVLEDESDDDFDVPPQNSATSTLNIQTHSASPFIDISASNSPLVKADIDGMDVD